MYFAPIKSVFPRACLWLIAAASMLSGCANYYQKHIDFNAEFEKGDLQQALDILQKKNGEEERSKTRFLHFANQGLLLSILGRYEESNAAFEKAFIFGEDYRVNYLNEAASYLTNPNFTVYRGEDHEHLMVLYFKAINFLKMNRPEDALVECRRLNIRLNQLSDKYSDEKKFQRDAFIHTLMGIIYQSTADYNNAFIAYRNALEVYEISYATMFGISVPEQLKLDLMNTAYWTGFTPEFEEYKIKFGMPDYTPSKPDADLVFFWHNGLGPVKAEWSVNFVINRKDDNIVVFTNDMLGMAFPFPLESKDDKSQLANLEVFRVAFPRYVERPVYFSRSYIECGEQTYPLELSEDINKVAFISLQQRMLQEFSKGLLRAALKKATEHSIRKDDERLGALIGLMNAITEQADTRNWQTLPHAIYYARVPLKEGSNQIRFNQESVDQKPPVTYPFTYTAQKGQTLFHTFSSLESLQANRMYPY
jgi:hypothetical protein